MTEVVRRLLVNYGKYAGRDEKIETTDEAVAKATAEPHKNNLHGVQT